MQNCPILPSSHEISIDTCVRYICTVPMFGGQFWLQHIKTHNGASHRRCSLSLCKQWQYFVGGRVSMAQWTHCQGLENHSFPVFMSLAFYIVMFCLCFSCVLYVYKHTRGAIVLAKKECRKVLKLRILFLTTVYFRIASCQRIYLPTTPSRRVSTVPRLASLNQTLSLTPLVSCAQSGRSALLAARLYLSIPLFNSQNSLSCPHENAVQWPNHILGKFPHCNLPILTQLGFLVALVWWTGVKIIIGAQVPKIVPTQ